jgi:glycosyltransferase involved in cell wall biosynthesis
MKKNARPKILFIARTYAPFVGGMEKFANDFYTNLQDFAQVDLLANLHGKRRIIQFFFKAAFHLLINANRYEIIHFNDAVLAPLVIIIKLCSQAKVTFTVHGLDIVFNKFGYQQLIIPFLRKADKIFPVSQYTKAQCLERGIPGEILVVIPNGLVFSEIKNCTQEGLQSLSFKIFNTFNDKTILLSLGRLIKRKGHVWFIKNVFIHLPEDYVYIIAGNGREFDHIAETIRNLKLDKRVRLLGFVSEKEKACLFELADLFIMPNIYDENDQEGFGIVLLEAGSYSLPIIAANIEGIKDAIIDGKTGILVEEKNVDAYLNAITQPNIQRDHLAAELHAKYDWSIISQKYQQAFEALLKA